MSLCDFALREKKQKEEEMTKIVQDTHRRQELICRLVERRVEAAPPGPLSSLLVARIHAYSCSVPNRNLSI